MNGAAEWPGLALLTFRTAIQVVQTVPWLDPLIAIFVQGFAFATIRFIAYGSGILVLIFSINVSISIRLLLPISGDK